MRLEFFNFGGIVPRTDSELLPAPMAQVAENVKLWNGKLRKFSLDTSTDLVTKAGAGDVLAIYRWGAVAGDPDSGHWFNWTADVDVMRGPIQGDTTERTYFTFADASQKPQMTFAGVATGGVDLPNISYDLGVPAPISGGEAVSVSGDVGEPEDALTRSYAITYVTEQGEEGPPLFFGEHTWYPGNTVSLVGLPTGPVTGSYDFGTKNIYRTVTGSEGTEFAFIGSVTMAATAYTDVILDSDMGDDLVSQLYDPPPEDMHSINALANGIAFGFSKNQVCIAEPNLPHAWNPLNRYTTDYPIVGGGKFDNTIVAVTEKTTHIITGYSPDTFDGQETPIPHGCVAKRSITEGSFGVGYAAERGYIVIGPAGPQVISEPYFSEDEWAEQDLSSMIAAVWNDRIIWFVDVNSTSQTGYLFDPRNPEQGLIALENPFGSGSSNKIGAFYADPLTKELWMVSRGGNLRRFDYGTGSMPMRWRSRDVLVPYETHFPVGRVRADATAQWRFVLYADGVERHSEEATGTATFRMPRGYRARRFAVQIENSADADDSVLSVEIAQSIRGLRAG